MVLLALLRKVTREKKKKKQRKQKVLSNWEGMYNALQEHPLTQAKIINEQLLNSNQEQINKIHLRLDSIEAQVGDLEKKINKRKAKSKKKEEPEVEQEESIKQVTKVRKIVAEANLSDQERAVIEHLRKQDESDAETIAEQFAISRSNASLKLNKLHKWGFLDKRLEEKTVFYRIKD